MYGKLVSCSNNKYLGWGVKKILLAFSLVCSAGVNAESEVPVENYVKACPLVYELAKTIMESRQMGMPIAEAIKPIIGVDDKDVQQLNKDLVIAAYKTPIGDSSENKQQIIDDFANQLALECLKAK